MRGAGAAVAVTAASTAASTAAITAAVTAASTRRRAAAASDQALSAGDS
jgi:hypothetical protein